MVLAKMGQGLTPTVQQAAVKAIEMVSSLVSEMCNFGAQRVAVADDQRAAGLPAAQFIDQVAARTDELHAHSDLS
jgi:hypothetical protein